MKPLGPLTSSIWKSLPKGVLWSMSKWSSSNIFLCFRPWLCRSSETSVTLRAWFLHTCSALSTNASGGQLLSLTLFWLKIVHLLRPKIGSCSASVPVRSKELLRLLANTMVVSATVTVNRCFSPVRMSDSIPARLSTTLSHRRLTRPADASRVVRTFPLCEHCSRHSPNCCDRSVYFPWIPCSTTWVLYSSSSRRRHFIWSGWVVSVCQRDTRDSQSLTISRCR